MAGITNFYRKCNTYLTVYIFDFVKNIKHIIIIGQPKDQSSELLAAAAFIFAASSDFVICICTTNKTGHNA